MRRVLRTLGIGVAVALIAGACSGDDGSETTTSDAVAPESAATTVTTTGPADGETATTATSAGSATSTTAAATSTTATAFAVPAFTIVSRTPGDQGDTVVILLDTDSYESLTDIDLQNVLADVVDEFPPIFEAHVVDSPDVVDLVTDPDLDEDAQQLLNVHYLVRLEEGFRIRYLGQFESNGVTILGS